MQFEDGVTHIIDTRNQNQLLLGEIIYCATLGVE